MDDRFNQTMSIVYIPILEQNELRGIIILNSPVSGTERVIGKINAYMFYTIIFSVVIALVISFLLSKMQVKRINRLRKATKTVTQGNYDIQLTSGQLDEIDDLTTDFNQMVQALARSKAEINRQEKRRRQFIADVSHEMRTPLTTISGLSEGLVNDLIPADQFPRSLALIEKEAKRLTKLVNENLDYERIISNKVHLQQTSFKVLPFLNTIKDQMLPLVKETGNEIKIDAPESLQIYADYDRLTQIVINVVKNSIQFTKKGTITLQATSNYKETLLTITDTGIGMDPAELTQIWERFYKADLSRTDTKYGEYGIGLTIVKQLVEQHHGRIEVKSKRGEGTTFSLYFPAPSVQ
ncbi:Sensor protein srrB [Listeria grayi]|uniref:histidine kinase n=1 Tax=Listeria grayi TaxID=1641 RepID=A0A378MCT7_LISGR|nr:HAMP domain-containing sensor histidine kinase [Listeria grayi]STY43316.1 Sensor protein srrB [Listeria grayi]